AWCCCASPCCRSDSSPPRRCSSAWCSCGCGESGPYRSLGGSVAGGGRIEPVETGLVDAGTDCALDGGGASSIQASPTNHLLSCGSRRWCSSVHSAREEMFSTNTLVGGVTRKTSTAAAAMAEEWPQCLASTSLSAVPKDDLMRVSMTSTE